MSGGNAYYYFSYAEMKDLYYFGLSFYDKLADMAEKKSLRLKRPLDLLYEHIHSPPCLMTII